MSDEAKEWKFRAGETVHYCGVPYTLKHDAILVGATNPHEAQSGATEATEQKDGAK